MKGVAKWMTLKNCYVAHFSQNIQFSHDILNIAIAFKNLLGTIEFAQSRTDTGQQLGVYNVDST